MAWQSSISTTILDGIGGLTHSICGTRPEGSWPTSPNAERHGMIASMSRKLKIHWVVWLVLTLTVAAGTTAFFLSTTPTRVDLDLVPDAGADVSVFRLLPGFFSLSLYFETKGNLRPELGSFEHYEKPRALEFPNPGATVKIQVSVRESRTTYVFEAMPAGSFGQKIGRDLVLFIDDGDPHRFPWPPNRESLPVLPKGTSHLHVSVLEVGHPILGERVELFVSPPLSFKSYMPGYGLLAFFFLWPVYVGALFVYAAVLLWTGHRNGKAPK